MSRRRILGTALLIVMVGALLRLPMSSAGFQTATTNEGNEASTLTIASPGTVTATTSLNVTPLLTCSTSISWTASTTPGVTGYEVVRIELATGDVDAGPWTTANLTLLDDPVPMWLLGAGYEWRVRSIVGSWRSTWTTGTLTNPLLCLL